MSKANIEAGQKWMGVISVTKEMQRWSFKNQFEFLLKQIHSQRDRYEERDNVHIDVRNITYVDEVPEDLRYLLGESGPGDPEDKWIIYEGRVY